MDVSKTLKYLTSSLARRFYQFKARKKQFISGLPPGINADFFHSFCQEVMEAAPKQTSYLHISGWKSSGAFRLKVILENGKSWNLVFKNAVYAESETPALKNLPLMPGPPEFMVYNRACSNDLLQYLPKNYLCQETLPGKEYNYLFEDLADTHYLLRYAPNKEKGTLQAAAELPRLHQALAADLCGGASNALLLFDHSYSLDLLDYAENNLTAYRDYEANDSLIQLLERWDELHMLSQHSQFDQPELLRPIHGDYNPSNIHLSNQNGGVLKAVDWEWAAMGYPHADLASLLKGTKIHSDFERQMLSAFAEQEKDLSLEEHRRLLRWCQLQRALLDAGFVARQELAFPNQISWMQGFIRESIQEILTMQQELG